MNHLRNFLSVVLIGMAAITLNKSLEAIVEINSISPETTEHKIERCRKSKGESQLNHEFKFTGCKIK